MNIHLKIVLCVTNRTVEKVVSAALQLLGKFLWVTGLMGALHMYVLGEKRRYIEVSETYDFLYQGWLDSVRVVKYSSLDNRRLSSKRLHRQKIEVLETAVPKGSHHFSEWCPVVLLRAFKSDHEWMNDAQARSQITSVRWPWNCSLNPESVCDERPF